MHNVQQVVWPTHTMRRVNSRRTTSSSRSRTVLWKLGGEAQGRDTCRQPHKCRALCFPSGSTVGANLLVSSIELDPVPTFWDHQLEISGFMPHAFRAASLHAHSRAVLGVDGWAVHEDFNVSAKACSSGDVGELCVSTRCGVSTRTGRGVFSFLVKEGSTFGSVSFRVVCNGTRRLRVCRASARQLVEKRRCEQGRCCTGSWRNPVATGPLALSLAMRFSQVVSCLVDA